MDLKNQIFIVSEKIIESIIVVTIGFILYTLSRFFIKKFLLRCNSSVSSRKYKTLSTILNSILKYIISFFVICKIFYFFGVDIKSILTFAGIGGITIGLGAQSLVKDFITGIFILFEDQFGVGDEVVIGNKIGTIEAITMRTTILKSKNGDIHIIPNSEIKIVTNRSRK